MRKMMISMCALLIALTLNGCAKEEIKEEPPVVETPSQEELEAKYWEEIVSKIQSSQGEIEIQLDEAYETMPVSVLKAIEEKDVKVNFTFKTYTFTVTKDHLPNMNEHIAGTTIEALISFYNEDVQDQEEEKPTDQEEKPTEPSVPETPSEPAEPQAPTEPSEPDSSEPEAPATSDKINQIMNMIYDNYQLPSFMELDAAMLNDVYGISSDMVTDFSVRMPMMIVHATEFAVFEVADGQMDAVKAGVEKRLADLTATWEQYLPNQLEMVKNAKTIEKGNTYILIISEYADEIVDQILSMF